MAPPSHRRPTTRAASSVANPPAGSGARTPRGSHSPTQSHPTTFATPAPLRGWHAEDMDLPGKTKVDGSEQRTRRTPSLWRMDFTLRNMLMLFSSAFFGLFLLELLFNVEAPFPRPPALSPPARARGLAAPSHYTFSGLSVITDLVAIALVQGQIGTKVQDLPCVHWGMSDKMTAALDDLEASARAVGAWLSYENEYWRPTSSVEGNQSWQAIREMCDACTAARNNLGRTHKDYSWHNLAGHGAVPLNDAYSEHRLQFEEDIWEFHPDEDDLGQYDDMDLVGRVNRHEATDLNRSAAIFLASLQSKHLPELLRFHHDFAAYHTPPEEFPIVKARVDRLVERVEQVSRTDWIEAARPGMEKHNLVPEAKPGWLRRAVLRAKGLAWEYPCRQEAIFNDDGKASKGDEDRYRWQDKEPAWRRSRWKHDDYYFYASAWPCALAAHRVVREKVLPMVRESQAALAEAEALYQSGVIEAGKKLDGQMRALLAGRGWEVVEEAQIGTTPDGHLVEVSRAKDMADSLVDIHNVTMWRRMVLPMGKRAIGQLKGGRRKLWGW